MKVYLQLGKLKENCLLLKLYCKLRRMFLSWPSLCHLSRGSSIVRASHRRSEGCQFAIKLE